MKEIVKHGYTIARRLFSQLRGFEEENNKTKHCLVSLHL